MMNKWFSHTVIEIVHQLQKQATYAIPKHLPGLYKSVYTQDNTHDLQIIPSEWSGCKILKDFEGWHITFSSVYLCPDASLFLLSETSQYDN